MQASNNIRRLIRTNKRTSIDVFDCAPKVTADMLLVVETAMLIVGHPETFEACQDIILEKWECEMDDDD